MTYFNSLILGLLRNARRLRRASFLSDALDRVGWAENSKSIASINRQGGVRVKVSLAQILLHNPNRILGGLGTPEQARVPGVSRTAFDSIRSQLPGKGCGEVEGERIRCNRALFGKPPKF